MYKRISDVGLDANKVVYGQPTFSETKVEGSSIFLYSRKPMRRRFTFFFKQLAHTAC